MKPVSLVLAMTALSVLPFAALMTTAFVRISVVLSILRGALGSSQLPPTVVLTGLSLVLTLAVMAPTGEQVLQAIRSAPPRADGLEEMAAAADRAKEPLRAFMLRHTSARERAPFLSIARELREPAARAAVGEQDLAVVVPAFVGAELRRGFEIGFLLFVPFLVVDLVIANLLLALGMHMLSPTTVSLPFKLLLFVLADGWQLVIRGLMEGYR